MFLQAFGVGASAFLLVYPVSSNFGTSSCIATSSYNALPGTKGAQGSMLGDCVLQGAVTRECFRIAALTVGVLC